SQGARRTLPSFPTRRSSDLHLLFRSSTCLEITPLTISKSLPLLRSSPTKSTKENLPTHRASNSRDRNASSRSFASVSFCLKLRRSEEHTSELQSRENLVCRL